MSTGNGLDRFLCIYSDLKSEFQVSHYYNYKLGEENKALCIIFNKSLRDGTLPNVWKTAHVSTIYKKGCKSAIDQ